MCLAVPGKVLTIDTSDPDLATGRVAFGGIVKEVCLSYVPDVQVGDYVLVHIGFALQKIDEAEAQEVFRFLNEMGELAELEANKP